MLVLSGGSQRGGLVTDVDAMAEAARALEISPSAPILDRRALGVVEHARAVAAIARQQGFDAVALGMRPEEMDRALFVGRDPLGRLAVTAEAAAEYLALGLSRLRGWI